MIIKYMEEIWKEINGFDGKFSVSNYGNVRQNEMSYIALDNRHVHLEEKLIQPITWQSRYLRVDLGTNRKDKKYRLNTYVHKLVAEYFIGERPEGYVIDHIDGNYLNNRADNLRYVTVKENMHNPVTVERAKQGREKFKSDKKRFDEFRSKISKKNKLTWTEKRRKAFGDFTRVNSTNRKWMTNGNNRVFVVPEQIDLYLGKGYHLGMK